MVVLCLSSRVNWQGSVLLCINPACIINFFSVRALSQKAISSKCSDYIHLMNNHVVLYSNDLKDLKNEKCTTGEKVSSKSIPCLWEYPFATDLYSNLNRLTLSCPLYWTLITHLLFSLRGVELDPRCHWQWEIHTLNQLQVSILLLVDCGVLHQLFLVHLSLTHCRHSAQLMMTSQHIQLLQWQQIQSIHSILVIKLLVIFELVIALLVEVHRWVSHLRTHSTIQVR